jgi:hypothetical protein
MKKQTIKTKHGTIIADPWEPPTKEQPKPKQRPITAERFERELNALNRVYNAGHINAAQHKKRYDVLIERLREAE